MDEQIASALGDAFPGRDVETVNPSGPSWNEQNRTVGIEFTDGEQVYLKMANDGNGTRIARERAVIAYLDTNRVVPVPDVLTSETNGEVPYLVTAPVAGENLFGVWSDASVSERAELARQVGNALASVHACQFENHGHIVGGDEDGLELETGAWTNVLIGRMTEMREIASSDRFECYFDQVIEAVEANRDLLDDAPATLLHGDPARPNCFFGEDGIGFLDWEIAHVGDPVRDVERTRNLQIGSLRADGSEEVIAAFYDGYRQQAGGLPDGFEERRPVYDAVRFLGHTGVFDKYAAFRDEDPEELADWMERVMNRRLAKIR